MAAAKTGIFDPVYGPIVQVSDSSDSDVADDEATDIDDDNVTDAAIQSIVERSKAITLTDGDDAAAAAKPSTSKGTAGKAASTSKGTSKAATSKGTSKAATAKGTSKAATSKYTAKASTSKNKPGTSKGTDKARCKTPSFKCNSKKNVHIPPSYKSYNTRISHKSKPRKTSYIVQDLITVVSDATANAGAGIRLLTTPNGREFLNTGEYYFSVCTISWKAGFMENGCYHWICTNSLKSLCNVVIKTTIIEGFHHLLKEINPKGPKAKHNHLPKTPVELLNILPPQ